MIIKVFDNISNKLEVPPSVLPENGVPQSHHFLSTQQDNLIELAGRTCYDSCKSTTKTRSSQDYHKHINDTNHGSVQEHINLTFEMLGVTNNQINDFISYSCHNRPGVWIDHANQKIRITANIRSIKEWDIFNNRCIDPYIQTSLGNALKNKAKLLCPQALSIIPDNLPSEFFCQVTPPVLPEEKWYSFYISDVSRGLTHELVRHKYQTAISQRSTRYVDESESDWAWHPLVLKYQDKLNRYLDLEESRFLDTEPSDDSNELQSHIMFSRLRYRNMVEFLENQLTSEGIDKFTARKQARGAARGILGNALSTELIWSASASQIKRIISQRANAGADAEIRLWANQLYEIMRFAEPDYFSGAKIENCPDGIGYSVIY